MKKRTMYIVAFGMILLSIVLIIPKVMEQELTVRLVIYMAIELISEAVMGIAVCKFFWDFFYRRSRGCKVYRYYKGTEFLIYILLVIAVLLTLMKYFMLIQSSLIESNLTVVSTANIFLFNTALALFNGMYINDKLLYLPMSDKEIEFKRIKDYAITPALNNIWEIKIVTDEKTYKLRATKYMTDNFRMSMFKAGQMKVY